MIPIPNIKPLPQTRDRYIVLAIWLFLFGWATVSYTVLDVGKYSILLIYIAAIPFCRWISLRSVSFLVLPFASALFAILVAFLKQVSTMSIVSQAALQMLALCFAAGVAALDWRKHLLSLTKAMVLISFPLVIYACYQIIARPLQLAYAFLPVTNQQAYATGGLQRGWGKAPFTRASSVFVEPSDFGYYCLWLLVLGLSAGKGTWRYCAIGLAFVGIVTSQSLTGGLGALVILLFYLFTNPISIQVLRQIAIVALFCVMSVLALQPLMPKAFDSFTDRIEQALTLDSRADSGRVDHIPANWAIFKEAPIFGLGMASLNSADQNGIDVTTMSYALLLMERGVVGTIFFLAPWLVVGARSWLMPASDSFRTPALLFTALHLYSFATNSLMYFLPFWLALAISASLVLRTHLPETQLAFNWKKVDDFRGLTAEA